MTAKMAVVKNYLQCCKKWILGIYWLSLASGTRALELENRNRSLANFIGLYQRESESYFRVLSPKSSRFNSKLQLTPKLRCKELLRIPRNSKETTSKRLR